ncbi:hypothetical protein V6N13_108406 [Hibiscus sabdariffa]
MIKDDDVNKEGGSAQVETGEKVTNIAGGPVDYDGGPNLDGFVGEDVPNANNGNNMWAFMLNEKFNLAEPNLRSCSDRCDALSEGEEARAFFEELDLCKLTLWFIGISFYWEGIGLMKI